MKKNLSTILLVLVMFVGFSLLLYPSVSDYWNSLHQTRAVAGYEEHAQEIDDSSLDSLWQEADEYNAALQTKKNRWKLSEEEYQAYEKIMDISGTGILGVLEIPEIKVSLPIYHGVDEGVLQVATGHMEGSSFPSEGKGVHTVLSGHRGLPSAKLLTNLDQMVEGDLFMINVLKTTLTYEVDQIRIVEPDDLSDLKIDPGKNYCTLVTCTPYGINSHRLLVRGHRVETVETRTVRVTSDAIQVEPFIVAIFLAGIILAFLLICFFISTGRRRK